jgi:hypothetical protein
MPAPWTSWIPKSSGNLSDSYIFGGFDQKQGGRLSGLVQREFLPEVTLARRQRSQIEDAFYNTLDPANAEAYVTAGAERMASDLLRPGGQVQQQISALRGGETGRGWGTQSGVLSRQENQALSTALNSTVGAYLGQAAPAMWEGAAGRTAGAYQLTQERVRDLLESLYTGLSGAESLRLAQIQPGLFGTEGLLGISGVPIL